LRRCCGGWEWLGGGKEGCGMEERRERWRHHGR